jgi:hypothetical protein
MAMGVAGNLMTGLVDSPNLPWVMVWALARKSRRAHHREAGGDTVFGVKLEEAFRVLEFEQSPVFWAPADAGAIGTPLCVVVPEEQQPRTLFAVHYVSVFCNP